MKYTYLILCGLTTIIASVSFSRDLQAQTTNDLELRSAPQIASRFAANLSASPNHAWSSVKAQGNVVELKYVVNQSSMTQAKSDLYNSKLKEDFVLFACQGDTLEIIKKGVVMRETLVTPDDSMWIAFDVNISICDEFLSSATASTSVAMTHTARQLAEFYNLPSTNPDNGPFTTIKAKASNKNVEIRYRARTHTFANWLKSNSLKATADTRKSNCKIFSEKLNIGLGLHHTYEAPDGTSVLDFWVTRDSCSQKSELQIPALAGQADGCKQTKDQVVKLNSCGELIKRSAYLYTAYYERSRALLGAKRFAEAISDDIKAIDLDPSLAGPYVVRGLSYHALRDYNRAIHDYDSAIEIDPSDVSFYVNRATALLEIGERDKAINDWTRVISLNPRPELQYTSYSTRANIYVLKRDFDLGIADATKAIQINPAALMAYLVRGNGLAEVGRYDDAFKDFDTVIQAQPQSSLAYSGRGKAFLLAGSAQKAVDDGSRSIEIDPKNASAYEVRGRALVQQGYYARGIKDLNIAAAMQPGLFQVFVARANAFGALHDNARALADYSSALDIAPNSATVLAMRATLYYIMNDVEHSQIDALKALSIDPKNIEARLTYGTVLINLGQFSSGVSEVSKVIEAEPKKTSEPYFIRGFGYESMGDKISALSDFKIALTLDPGAADVKDAIARVSP